MKVEDEVGDGESYEVVEQLLWWERKQTGDESNNCQVAERNQLRLNIINL